MVDKTSLLGKQISSFDMKFFGVFVTFLLSREVGVLMRICILLRLRSSLCLWF